MQNDIALLQLAQNVDFSGPFVGAACLPNKTEDYRGTDGCWLSGNPCRQDNVISVSTVVTFVHLHVVVSCCWKNDSYTHTDGLVMIVSKVF